MRTARLLGLALPLLLVATSAAALDVTDPNRFTCRQGNCVNGQGTAWDMILSVAMKGVFRNGQTIPGETYTLTVPRAPGKTYRQVYGANGLLAEGDMPRTLGGMGEAIPYFSGEYQTIRHAFMRDNVAVIKRGVYYTGIGIEYRGRFEYLAARSGIHSGIASGYYIFYGDKIDTEEDEKETGLFISDEILAATPVRFIKATPSYLAHLQRQYLQELELAKSDFAEKDAEKKWRTALAIIGRVSMALAGGGLGGNGGGGGGLGGDIAMNIVSGLMDSGSSGVNVQDLALQTVGSLVTGDKKLGSALGKAISEGLEDGNSLK